MENYQLIAKTFAGLEPVLAGEITRIGGRHVKQGRRAVFYEGDLKVIYRSNYYLRTALRVLKEIDRFRFKDVDQFYLKCKQINWGKHLSTHQDFAVKSTVVHSGAFNNSMFASLKVKDAVVDHFRERTGKRPNVDPQNPAIVIHVHISGNSCSVSSDSSGESLHKRGYRVRQGEAPLSEVLAAGMILTAEWKGDTDFIDPMCGAGTLPVEAAMIARDIAPGRFRKTFAFMNWPGYHPELFEKVKNERPQRSFSKKIFAADVSEEAILAAKTNARRARVFSSIEFQDCAMENLKINSNNAVIIMNPPYGERLKEENIQRLYHMIGERLKHRFTGNTAWILSTSGDNLKNIGLKPARKMELYNGALKCLFVCYPLFKGKRKNQ